MSKKTVFNRLWLDDPEFSQWLQEVKDSPHEAFCASCKASFALSNMGRQAVKSHAGSSKHGKSLKAAHEQAFTMSAFFQKGRSTTTAAAEGCPTSATGGQEDSVSQVEVKPADCTSVAVTTTTDTAVVSIPVPSVNRPNTMTGYVTNDQVTTAEIIWAMKTVVSHFSLNSSRDMKDIFQQMFVDSSIAKRISIGSTKLAYVITYGLSPYFHNSLLNKVLKSPKVVICFDEALNRISQRGQMDVAVRFWDTTINQVSSRYFGSAFMGHATAQCVLNSFKEASKEIPINMLLQVGMDGPSVNWKFLDLLSEETGDTKLVDLGSCGLHSVHGSFQCGHKAAGWNVNGYLRSMHNLFKDSPARRADYAALTGSNRYPLKFCQIRWVENTKVATRALELLPNVRKFVENAKKLPNTVTTTTIQSLCADNLAAAKIAFFASLGSEFEVFLTKYQSAAPLAPFIYDDVTHLLRSLMNRCVKKSVMKEASTVAKLMKVDLDNKDNLCTYKEVDIGVGATKELRNAKGTDAVRMNFHMECRKYLVAAVNKIVERSPLSRSIVRAISGLVPETIRSNPSLAENRVKDLLQMLYDKGQISAVVADKGKIQFSELTMKASGDWRGQFRAFNRNTDRLDDFYYSLIGLNTSFTELFLVVRLGLMMSHGNAFVEGGFSINSDILVENLHEDSIVAQRTVYDAIQAVGGIAGVTVDKSTIMYVRTSHRRYQENLERARQAEANTLKQQSTVKRISVEIQELQAKKKKLEKESAAECYKLDTQIAELAKTKQTFQ